MTIAEECADSTYKVCRRGVVDSVDVSCRRDERSRRERRAEELGGDVTGGREGSNRSLM